MRIITVIGIVVKEEREACMRIISGVDFRDAFHPLVAFRLESS